MYRCLSFRSARDGFDKALYSQRLIRLLELGYLGGGSSPKDRGRRRIDTNGRTYQFLKHTLVESALGLSAMVVFLSGRAVITHHIQSSIEVSCRLDRSAMARHTVTVSSAHC